MRVGVIFPQTESGTDPQAIREYAQAAEALGYDYITMYDHVAGAHPSKLSHLQRIPYTHEHSFHEVFVLLGYLAAVTVRIELALGVLVLPQRQTVLAAKQAAEVDILSRGRFRLAVGVGWNEAEYEALNENFRNRGRRQEEQVQVMRLLWSQPLVEITGRYHRLDRVGLKPLPERQIPVWFGGGADRILERIAEWGDGWLPPPRATRAEVKQALERLHGLMRQKGRDAGAFGVEGRVNLPPDAALLAAEAEAWRDVGATHLSINTMGCGFKTLAEHIRSLGAAARVLL